MGNENKALDILVSKIMSACESLIKKYKADHTFKTTIWKVNDDGTYQINYLGQTYNVPSAVGSLKLGQQVWLKIPNGIFREMHIYGVTENTGGGGGGESSHTHSNLSVLETITSALINKWNDAYSKAHTHTNKDSLDTITPEKIESWDNKSEFDGNYNSLTNKPTIPSAYIHPNSGVTAGTYKSVTVNAQGHVTSGSNPTTIAGYGIIDAATEDDIDELERQIDELRNGVDITRTTDTTLYNSYEGGIKINEIGGNSEQRTTTGAQLLNYDGNLLTDTNGSIIESQYVYSAIISLGGNEKVYVSGDFSLLNTSAIRVGLLNEHPEVGGSAKYDAIKKSGVLDTTGYNYVLLSFSVYGMNTTLEQIVNSFIANWGDTPLPWEPYTGNAPSPSPDYPQEIESIVLSEIKASGKNLLKNTATTQTVNGVIFTVNDDGSVTANGTATANAVVILNKSIALENGKEYILSGCPSGGSISTYRLQGYMISDGTFVYDYGQGIAFIYDESKAESNNIAISILAGQTVNNLTFSPMIRKADIEDSTYEPYQESTITLSNPITLNGIGDIKDRIVRRDGVWDKNFRFAEAVFDGSDDEKWSKSSTLDGRYIMLMSDAKEYAESLCTHATMDIVNDSLLNTCAINAAKYFYINTSFATLEEWKAHLQSKPMKVVYELAEEMFEPLPTADQIALNSLVSFDTMTYLSTDSEIEPTFDVEYGTSKVGGVALQACNEGCIAKYHVNDEFVHISETEKNKLQTAYAHSQSAHAPSNAEANQNAFSNVKVSTTTISADTKTDTLELVAGTNVTLTPDATNDKIIISSIDTVYTHPNYTARIGVPTANQTPAFGGTFTVSQPVSDGTGHITAINSRTITIPNTTATTTKSGLMSATDKKRFDRVVIETISSTEPTDQSVGDHWLLEY